MVQGIKVVLGARMEEERISILKYEEKPEYFGLAIFSVCVPVASTLPLRHCPFQTESKIYPLR